MAEYGQNKELVIRQKQGLPVYSANPSIPTKGEISRNRKAQLGNEKKGLVIDGGTGEIMGHGGAIFYEWEEVDRERFVKLFLAGFKQASGLSKAGLSIFSIVYGEMRDTPNSDRVELNFYMAKKQIDDLTERTYRRGLRELLDREFLFRSPSDGIFFVNIRYMFNGDRLAFVKAYQLKGSQPELPLPVPEPRDG